MIFHSFEGILSLGRKLDQDLKRNLTDLPESWNESWLESFHEKDLILFVDTKLLDLGQIGLKILQQIEHWDYLIFETLCKHMGQVFRFIGKKSYWLLDIYMQVFDHYEYKKL